jgi:hypothetical protein
MHWAEVSGMATTTGVSSGTAMQDLADRLIKKFDTNSDGKLSAEEFGGLLSGLLGKDVAGGSIKTAFAQVNDRTPVGTMSGFDAGKLADTNHRSVKYEVARVLQFYPNTPAGLQAALPELQALFPNVTITGSKGDKLDFGDYERDGTRIGVVDVIQGAGDGGRAWAWMPEE